MYRVIRRLRRLQNGPILTFCVCRRLCNVATAREFTRPADLLLPVIGLEIHAQISSKSKLFSGASTDYGGLTNNQVAFLDASLPGTLPVLNEACVFAGIKTSLALNCRVNMESYFDRKHYFYADMPAGYQVTQQRRPLAVDGCLEYTVGEGSCIEHRTAKIWRLQLEQDSGKSLHDAEQRISLIDLNRAGVGLMEIVTAPDFVSGEEAGNFVKELQLVLQILGTCDGKMEEGSLRVDASVSLHHDNQPLGVRAEVKNLNSVRFVRRAIDYEISRQRELLERGLVVDNETRSYDPVSDTTMSMRDKEKVHDYRFLPEPNLLPLRIYDNKHPGPEESINVDTVTEDMPLLPSQRRHILVEAGVNARDAVSFVNLPELWDLFVRQSRCEDLRPRVVCEVLLGALYVSLKTTKETLESSEITLDQIGEVIRQRQDNAVTLNTAKHILAECLKNPNVDVTRLIKDRGWQQITDPREVEAILDQVVRENPHLVKKYMKRQKTRHYQKLVSLYMEKCQETVELAVVKETIQRKLTGVEGDQSL